MPLGIQDVARRGCRRVAWHGAGYGCRYMCGSGGRRVRDSRGSNWSMCRNPRRNDRFCYLGRRAGCSPQRRTATNQNGYHCTHGHCNPSPYLHSHSSCARVHVTSLDYSLPAYAPTADPVNYQRLLVVFRWIPNHELRTTRLKTRLK